MEEKIKYVLNGETKYYTKEELKAYRIQLQKNSGIYFGDDIEDELEHIIAQLKKYNGDPYGNIKNEERRIFRHEAEAKGFLIVTY